MGKIKEEYIVDKFIDVEGIEKIFVMAAISEDLRDREIYIDDCESPDLDVVAKRLMIGIAICDPRDNFNEELGKRIAKGKAMNQKSRVETLVSTSAGMINSKVVRAVLEQEAEFFKEHPENYIARYKKQKENKTK